MRIVGNNDVLVTIDDLKALNARIVEGSIYNGLSKFNTGQSKSWANIANANDRRKVLIYYNTIPSKFKVSYGLPSTKELQCKANDVLKTDKLRIKQNANFLKQLPIQEAFDNAAKKGYVKFNPVYQITFTSDLNKVVEHATKHAIADTCVKLSKQEPKVSIKAIHEVYKSLPYKWVITNYSRFTIEFKKWQAGNINMLHGAQGKPCLQTTKLTQLHKGLIEKYAMHPNRYGKEMIAKLVNKECMNEGKQTISAATVSKYINDTYNKNRLSYYRNTEYFNSTVMPSLRRKEVQFAGDLYYADGTPINIPCWNADMTKVIRLSMFVVMDVMSGKIVGMDLAPTEDRYNWLSAIKMAFDLEAIAPFELKYDNASATKTEEFVELKDKMLLKGCLFTPTKKANPKEKAQVERFIETLQSMYFRMIDGYIGEGIRSRRDNGRVNPHFLTKMQRKDNLYNYESMVKIIAELVGIYNASKRPRKP